MQARLGGVATEEAAADSDGEDGDLMVTHLATLAQP